jgi:homoserine/homoserine lactone efflux protein
MELMSFHAYLAFLAASIILLVIPGPTVLTVISYSLSHGKRAGVVLTTAVALGDSTALALSLLGLGAVLAASAFWFTFVKLMGGLYLIYLGAGLILSGVRLAEAGDLIRPGSRRRVFADTYLVTALNPKSILFFVAFLPQFVDPIAPAAPQLWLLAISFVSLAAINTAMYSVFAASARRVLTSPFARRYLHLTGGSLLSAAGIWALLARRPV